MERIQEHELDDRSRRIGSIVVAVLGVSILTLAVGMVIGRAADAPTGTETDPLDALGPLAAVGSHETGDAAEASNIEASDLTFQEALTGEEERPEVLAALRAAAIEEANLAAADGASEAAPEAAPAQAPRDALPVLRGTTLPAVVAAGDARRTLAQVADRDPLIAAAIEGAGHEPLVPGGQAGLYTLHVISYETAAAARRFARELRVRGHHAFVTEARVEEREPTWRVRIGPFDTRREATKYRETFEAQEGMNTFVVRRERKKPAA